MIGVEKEPRYDLVDPLVFDNGHDSDDTLYSEGRNARSKSTRKPTQRNIKTEQVLTWLRWGLVVTLQIIMIMVLLVSRRETAGQTQVVETGGDINKLYVPTSHKITLLAPDEDMYFPNITSDDNRMEIRHNWDMLMPLGSGSVSIPNWKDYPMLGEPISDDPLREGPLFEASWTHALHCLYYHVDTYHQLMVHGITGDENPYHAAHCFEYLRNSILCSADMTLEGQPSTTNEGEGQAHVCRDREEAIAWIEARRVDDLQDVVGPVAVVPR